MIKIIHYTQYSKITQIQGIRFECFQDGSCYKNKKEVAMEYSKDNYEILNFNLIPPPSFNLFQLLYKWIFY